ncbi:MAG: 7-cyano-7-deazaguanine synthase QueC [Candidatus Aureabacteria bacterium]|nr:7-cyano-7-deazaguanine synthase QueC [Candidatus Auribacterota bacterium]
MGKKAVVLLSGGLDSATVAAIAGSAGFDIYALTFDYGQRHRTEIACAKKIAAAVKAKKHMIFRLDMRKIGGSALTSGIKVPKRRKKTGAIPVTYVPARNTIFLSVALAWAETIGSKDIFIGANAVDYSGYPDCRAEYLKAYEKMAALAVKPAGKKAIKIHSPLVRMSKSDIIKKGIALGVDFSKTHSCYDPPAGKSAACGECDSCIIRKKGFKEAGLRDPIRYKR